MTDIAAVARADLSACFDLFERTADRLETLPAYAVGGSEEERLRAFRLGLPRPERSVRTSPWLARVARTTATGGTACDRSRRSGPGRSERVL